MLGERKSQEVRKHIVAAESAKMLWNLLVVLVVTLDVACGVLALLDWDSGPNIKFGKSMVPRAYVALGIGFFASTMIMLVIIGPLSALSKKLKKLRREEAYSAGLEGRRSAIRWDAES